MLSYGTCRLLCSVYFGIETPVCAVQFCTSFVREWGLPGVTGRWREGMEAGNAERLAFDPLPLGLQTLLCLVILTDGW